MYFYNNLYVYNTCCIGGKLEVDSVKKQCDHLMQFSNLRPHSTDLFDTNKYKEKIGKTIAWKYTFFMCHYLNFLYTFYLFFCGETCYHQLTQGS